jgi:pimeloyl-ACP methyl ester carboxylesterase
MAADSRVHASRRFYRVARRVYNSLPFGSDWRWPLKRAFFETVGRAYLGTDLYQGYYQEHRWRESLAVARERSLASRPLDALPAVDRPCVVIWGMVDWHFRVQRPQHLARAFCAAGHRVLYVSPLFESSKKPGFRAERVVDELRRATIFLARS